MGTSSAMLAAARASLGLRGRPNVITREYAGRHGSTFLRASWCDMSVTYWARHSGNTVAVLPGGDRAYTVWHAQDFNRKGHWHAGTRAEVLKAQPGDVVFFDWGNTDRIEAIDHIGVVEKNLGDGRLQTIEGNTSDACLRRVRSYTHIAGYGRPTYDASAPATPTQQEDDMDPNTIVKVPAYWADKARSKFSHPTYSAAFLWAGTLNEVRSYGARIEAKLAAQQVTIAELTKAVAALAANSASVDPDALVARIQDAINKVTVHLDVESEPTQ